MGITSRSNRLYQIKFLAGEIPVLSGEKNEQRWYLIYVPVRPYRESSSTLVSRGPRVSHNQKRRRPGNEAWDRERTESDKARLRWWAVHHEAGARGIRAHICAMRARICIRVVNVTYVSARGAGQRAIKCVSSIIHNRIGEPITAPVHNGP